MTFSAFTGPIPNLISKIFGLSIEALLKKHPDVEKPEDIALLLEIDVDLVITYMDSKPLTSRQKKFIVDMYNKGYNVSDIKDQLLISNTKIMKHLEATILVFDSKEGKKVLEIIYKHFDKVPISKLREMIINEDLKLQDALYILSMKNETECKQIFHYFKRFKESENFFQLDTSLTMQDIILMKEGNLTIEQLSMKLKKVECVIRDYLHTYEPYPIEKDYYKQLQRKRIENNIVFFGRAPKTLEGSLIIPARFMMVSIESETIILYE